MSHGHGGRSGGAQPARRRPAPVAAAHGLRRGGGVLPGRAGRGLGQRVPGPARDAGHMAADVVALGAALVADPDRHPRRRHRTTHLRLLPGRGVRLGLAVLLMLAVAGYVTLEAVDRLTAPAAGGIGPPDGVAATPLLVVGALGLAVNLVALLVLRGGAGESLNVKGAYLEVLADALGRGGRAGGGGTGRAHRSLLVGHGRGPRDRGVRRRPSGAAGA